MEVAWALRRRAHLAGSGDSAVNGRSGLKTSKMIGCKVVVSATCGPVTVRS